MLECISESWEVDLKSWRNNCQDTDLSAVKHLRSTAIWKGAFVILLENKISNNSTSFYRSTSVNLHEF